MLCVLELVCSQLFIYSDSDCPVYVFRFAAGRKSDSLPLANALSNNMLDAFLIANLLTGAVPLLRVSKEAFDNSFSIISL
jgi:hypothetical protein